MQKWPNQSYSSEVSLGRAHGDGSCVAILILLETLAKKIETLCIKPVTSEN